MCVSVCVCVREYVCVCVLWCVAFIRELKKQKHFKYCTPPPPKKKKKV